MLPFLFFFLCFMTSVYLGVLPWQRWINNNNWYHEGFFCVCITIVYYNWHLNQFSFSAGGWRRSGYVFWWTEVDSSRDTSCEFVPERPVLILPHRCEPLPGLDQHGCDCQWWLFVDLNSGIVFYHGCVSFNFFFKKKTSALKSILLKKNKFCFSK